MFYYYYDVTEHFQLRLFIRLRLLLSQSFDIKSVRLVIVRNFRWLKYWWTIKYAQSRPYSSTLYFFTAVAMVRAQFSVVVKSGSIFYWIPCRRKTLSLWGPPQILSSDFCFCSARKKNSKCHYSVFSWKIYYVAICAWRFTAVFLILTAKNRFILKVDVFQTCEK